MITIPGRIPIVIHPVFWLLAGMIGWFYSQSLIGILIWIAIIFISVLFHEFGHALTAVLFRQKTQIQLVALGGVTSYDGPKLNFLQQFIIVLNGPIAGFILCFIATVLLHVLPSGGLFYGAVRATQIANLFWSIINLVPVLPLDGGQLLRIALEGIFGVKGFKASLLIGATIGLLLSLAFFILQQFLVGAFFFLFAFQSFDLWRKNRLTNRTDREDSIRRELARAEEALQKGDKKEAKNTLEEVRKKAPGGVAAANASQALAFLLVEEGDRNAAYALLLPIRDVLAQEALCLLHELAAEQENQSIVAELSTECYQFAPNRDVAMRNARAFAALRQPQHAGGWLQTAWQHGPFDLDAQIHDRVYDGVRDDPLFREFVDPLQKKS